MGLWNDLRSFFGGTSTAAPTQIPPEAALALTKQYIDQGKLPMPSLKTLGISGTTNWAGSPMVEENDRLKREAGYGLPGTETWGEWERMVHTNPYVSCALEFVTAPLRDAKVEVVPAEEQYMSDRALAQTQADYARWCLLEHVRPGWSGLMEQLVRGGVGTGFALHEKVFGQVQHPLLPGGTGYALDRLAERLPSSIHPNGWREQQGQLTSILQEGQLPDGSWGRTEMPASKVLLFTRNRNGNNYLGFSQFRPVYFIVRAMAEIVKTFAIAVIREGAGIPVAYCEDANNELSKGQQKTLRKLLSNTVVHEYASLVLPPGWKADWITSKGANKGHVVEVYQSMGMLVLMQVFAQQLVLGTGSTGSRSVGQVHDLRADSFVTGLVGGLLDLLNGDGREPGTGLICDFIWPNWGRQPAYPKLVLTPKKPRVDPVAKATATKTAIDAGVMTPTLDIENSLREDFGYEPISEEDRAKFQAERQARALATAQAMGSAAAANEDGEDGEDNEDEDSPTPPPKKFGQLRLNAFTPSRPLRESEKVLDLAAMDSFLKQARTDFERGARPLVGEMLLRALPAVRAAMKDGRIDHGEIAQLPLDMGRVLEFCGDFITKARAEGRRQLAAEKARGRAPKPGELVTAPVHLASEEERDDDKPAPEDGAERQQRNDELLDAEKARLARRMESRLRQQLEATAIDVERTGGEADDVVRDVMDEQLDTGAFKSDAGGVLMKAFNLGRDDFMAQHGDEVDGVELSSALDENTCDYCENLDGEEFDYGSAGYEENTPPLRQCEGKNLCRCLYTVQWKAPGFSDADD